MKASRLILPITASLLILAGCSEIEDPIVYSKRRKSKGKLAPYCIKGVWYYPQPHYSLEEEGIASYYGINDNEHEGPDAMGGIYNMHKMTAAHKTLPLPSVVHVHNLHNNRQTIVAITDRGPFVDGRIIDLSVQAAKTLGFFGKGTAKVRIKALERESQIFARLTQNICLKSCNLSDLLPHTLQLAQAMPAQNGAPPSVGHDSPTRPPFADSKSSRSSGPKPFVIKPSQTKPRTAFHNAAPTRRRMTVLNAAKPVYVSIQNLSFDQAMWVRIQSVTYKWGHPRIQKTEHSTKTPFISRVGPFLSVKDAQKALRFFIKHKMSAIILPSP